MSRIGRLPVPLPSGVDVQVKDDRVVVKGPNGELAQEITRGFEIAVEGSELKVSRPSDSKEHRALHGLYRALINNMVTGVTKGFERELEIEGVGYNAKAEGPRKLVLNIGFCHAVNMEPPEGVTVETPKPTSIVIKGADKQKVGQFAAEVRRVRPPEPYKGKGIRYKGEYVRRKAGKAVGGK